MNLDVETKNKLKEKYRVELYETENLNTSEIDEFVSDEELKTIISINNSEMGSLINKKPLDVERIKKLFIANVNFYKLAKARNISIPGSSFLRNIASVVGYDYNKLCAELTTGKYESIFESRTPTTSEVLDAEYQSRRK